MELSDVFYGYPDDEKWLPLLILFALLLDVDIPTPPEIQNELNPQ